MNVHMKVHVNDNVSCKPESRYNNIQLFTSLVSVDLLYMRSVLGEPLKRI
jgi:hypothetical protein